MATAAKPCCLTEVNHALRIGNGEKVVIFGQKDSNEASNWHGQSLSANSEKIHNGQPYVTKPKFVWRHITTCTTQCPRPCINLFLRSFIAANLPRAQCVVPFRRRGVYNLCLHKKRKKMNKYCRRDRRKKWK